MTTEVTRVESKSGGQLPVGTHHGKWGGYHVNVGDRWLLTTTVGVRGIDIPCTVTATADGRVTVSAGKEAAPPTFSPQLIPRAMTRKEAALVAKGHCPRCVPPEGRPPLMRLLTQFGDVTVWQCPRCHDVWVG